MATVITIPGSPKRWRTIGVLVSMILLLTYLVSQTPQSQSWLSMEARSNLRDEEVLAGGEEEELFSNDQQEVSLASPELPEIYTSTIRLQDGTERFDRRRRADGEAAWKPAAENLFLILSKDEKSWKQKDRDTPMRSVEDGLKLIESTKLDLRAVSLAIMTTAHSEYESIIFATEKYPFARVTVLLREPDSQLESIAGQHRHAAHLQHLRRSALARVRNYLMVSALENEQHIFWLDADVVHFSPGIVQTMIKHSETNPKAGIMTVLTRTPSEGNYDNNAFKTNHPEWMEKVLPEDKFEEATNTFLQTRLGMEHYIEETTDDSIKEIDSVGGTLLYMRAGLVKQGLMFTWYNVIGTSWAKEGWVGLETEGICYAARFMEGGGCYVLGGNNIITHTNE